jgi:hypothetical protein
VKSPILFLLLPAVLLQVACGGHQITEPTAEKFMPVESEAAPTATETNWPEPTETSTPQALTPTEISAPTVVGENLEITAVEPTAVSNPTATVEPTIEVVEPVAVQIISGQTAEGAYFYGNPDAPITLLDYSDFL